MAIQLTSEECQAVMSLFRQFEFPNYDHNCRAEEDWLKNPERRKALYSARTKLLSAEAKTPDAVRSVQAPASPVTPAPVKPVVNPAATTTVRLDTNNLVSGPVEKTEEAPKGSAVSLSSIPSTSPAANLPAAEVPAESEAPKPEAPKAEVPKVETKVEPPKDQKKFESAKKK